MDALTSAELDRLRSHPQHFKPRLAVYNPIVVWSGRLAISHSKGSLSIIVTTTSGDVDDILPDTVLLIGEGVNQQRIRIRSAAGSTIQLSENSIDWQLKDFDLLQAQLYFPPMPVFHRIVNDDGTIVYFEDFDLSYVDQNVNMDPVVNMGPAMYALEMDPSASGTFATLVIDADEESFVYGSTISSYDYDVLRATTYPFQPTVSELGTVGTFRFYQPGDYMIACTATAATGRTYTGYRPVKVVDSRDGQTDSPFVDFNVESLSGSRDSGYWESSLSIFEDCSIADFPRNVPICVYGSVAYGEGASRSTEHVPWHYSNTAHQRFVGWIKEEAWIDEHKTKGRVVSVEAVGLCGALEEIRNYPSWLKYETTPAEWTDMNGLSVDRMLWFYMRRRTNLLRMTDWHPTGDTLLANYSEVANGRIFTSMREYLTGTIFADMASDRSSALWTEVDAQMKNDTDRPSVLTDAHELTTADRMDELNMPTTRDRPEVTWLSIDGLYFDGSDNTPMIAWAPGYAYNSQGGDTEDISGLITPATQAELNEWAGRLFSLRNNPFKDLDFETQGVYPYDIAPQASVRYSGMVSGTFREETVDGMDLFIRSVSDNFSPDLGLTVGVGCEAIIRDPNATVSHNIPKAIEGVEGIFPPDFEGIDPDDWIINWEWGDWPDWNITLPVPYLDMIPGALVNGPRLVGVAKNGNAYWTANLLDDIPIWNEVQLGVGPKILDADIDIASPLYQQTGDTINMWVLTPAGIWLCEDVVEIAGSVTSTLKHTPDQYIAAGRGTIHARRDSVGQKVMATIHTGDSNNLCEEPSFEKGLLNWGDPVGSGTIARSTNEAQYGNYSIRFQKSAGSDLEFYYGFDAGGVYHVACKPSTDYTVSAYGKQGGETGSLSISLIDNLGNESTAGEWDPPTGSWVRKSSTLTTGATATSIAIKVKSKNTADDVDIYIDGFQITESSSAFPYGDGDQANNVWAEDPHYSETLSTAVSRETDIMVTSNHGDTWTEAIWSLNDNNSNTEYTAYDSPGAYWSPFTDKVYCMVFEANDDPASRAVYRSDLPIAFDSWTKYADIPQSSHTLCGELRFPYEDNADDGIFYFGGYDGQSFRLWRYVSGTITDISPPRPGTSRRNLSINGSFEQSIAHWDKEGVKASITRVTGLPESEGLNYDPPEPGPPYPAIVSGSWAAKIVGNGGASAGIIDYMKDQGTGYGEMDVEPGEEYILTWFVQDANGAAAATDQITVKVQSYNGSSTQELGSYGPYDPHDLHDWTRRGIKFTVPAAGGYDKIWIEFDLDAGSTTNHDFWLDAVMVEKVPNAVDYFRYDVDAGAPGDYQVVADGYEYFDGSHDDCAWEGTPFNSVSRQLHESITNLVENPSVEVDLSQFSGSAGHDTFARVTGVGMPPSSEGDFGDYVLHVADTTGLSFDLHRETEGNTYIQVEREELYMFSFYYKAGPGHNIGNALLNVGVRGVRDGGGTWEIDDLESLGALSPTSEWQRSIAVCTTADETGEVYMHFAEGGTGNWDVYFVGFQFEKVVNNLDASPYCDGDQDLGEWVGIEHDSQSSREIYYDGAYGLNNAPSAAGPRIYVYPQDRNTIICAAKSTGALLDWGLFLSTDQGNTWQVVKRGQSDSAFFAWTRVWMSGYDPNVLFTVRQGFGSLGYSNDQGVVFADKIGDGNRWYGWDPQHLVALASG